MGKTTQQTSQTNSPPPNVLQNYQDLVNRATGVANTPYQQYQGQIVPDLVNDQLLAMQRMNYSSTVTPQYYDQAQTDLNRAAAPIDLSNAGQYISPYTTYGANSAIGAGQGIASYGTNAGQGIASYGTNAGQGIAGYGTNAGQDIAGYGTNAGQGIAGYGTNAGQGIAGYGVNAGQGIAGFGVNTGQGISDYGTNAGQNVANFGTAAGQNLANFGTNAGQNVANYGANAGQNIAGMAQNIGAQGPQLQQFNSQNISQYMNPYTQQVVDATMANINRTNGIQQNDLVSRAIMGGNAFGGDRAGVAAAELARNQDLASNQTIANLFSQGYGQALNQFNTGNQQALAGQQTALGGVQAGAQLGLGAQQAGAQLGTGAQQAGAQLGTGAQQAGAQIGLGAQQAGGQLGLGALQSGSQLGLGALQGGSQLGLGALQGGSQLGLGALQSGSQLGANSQQAGAQLGLSGAQLGTQGGQAAQQLSLAQQQAQNSNALNAGNSMGNLGTAALNSYLASANAQLQSGNQQQAQWASQLQVPYQQFLQQQAYPFQTTQFLQNAVLGTGSASGGSGTTTSPGPNILSQALGLGATAAGAFMASDERVKQNKEIIGKTFDGQPIYRFNYVGSPTTQLGLMAQNVEHSHPDAVAEHGGLKYVNYDAATDQAADKGHFAEGGVVGLSANAPGLFQPIDFNSHGVRGYVPDAGQLKMGKGPPAAPNAPSANAGTPNWQQSGAAIGKGLAGGPASYGGGSFLTDSYGGSSSNPLEGLTAADYGTGFATGGLVGPDAAFQGFAEGGGPRMHDEMLRADRWRYLPDPRSAENRDELQPQVGSDTSQILWGHPANTPRYNQGDASTERPPQWLSSGGLARFADGGMPAEIIDQTDLPPLQEVSPQAMEEWRRSSDFALNHPDSGDQAQAFAPTDAPGLVPMPRPRPAGIDEAPAGDIPPAPASYNVADRQPARLAAAPPPDQPTAPQQAPSGGLGSFLSSMFSPSQANAQGAQLPPGMTATQFRAPMAPPSVSQALMAAGLGMMSSRSPTLFGGIGEGGAAGLQNYQAQVAERNKLDAHPIIDHSGPTTKIIYPSTGQIIDTHVPTMTAGQQATNDRLADQHAETVAARLEATRVSEQRYKDALEERKRERDVPAGFRKDAEGNLEPIPGGPQDPKIIKAASDAKRGTAGLLDEETLSDMAGQYLAGDKSVMQNLGRGAQGAENIVKLRAEIGRQAREAGLRPDQVATKMADFAGRTAAMRTLGTRGANVEYAANTANKAIDLAEEAYAKLPRGQFVPFNQLRELYEKKTSSAEQAAAYAATNTLVNEYARVASGGSSTATEGMRQHAREMLNTAQGPDAFNAVLKMMRREIQTAKSAYNETRKEFLEDHSTAKPASTPAAAPATQPGAAAAPAAGAKPTLQEFLAKAKGANPNATDQQLTDYYNKKYGS